MPAKHDAYTKIIEQGMLPLFYDDSPTVSLNVIRALYKAGIRVIEYTNRGDFAKSNFEEIKSQAFKEMPGLLLGIGTIKQTADALEFISLQADFIVSPIFSKTIAELCNSRDILYIPGCFTPTEIHHAQEFSSLLIKIFPAQPVGPGFITAIKEIFPGQAFMPTGGVELNKENIMSWFKSGVAAVGFGSKLVSKEILANKSYDLLYEQAFKAVNIVKDSRKMLGLI